MRPGSLRHFRRVTRRIINLLTILSVLSFAAVGALWVDAALRGGRGRVFGSTTDGVTFVNITGGMQLVAGDFLATRFPTKQVREWSFPGLLYPADRGPVATAPAGGPPRHRPRGVRAAAGGPAHVARPVPPPARPPRRLQGLRL